MSKFILEFDKGKFTMSLIDDFMPTSTRAFDSYEDAVREMLILLKGRTKSKRIECIESIKALNEELDKSGYIQVDLMGINLINMDYLRYKISNQVRDIVRDQKECLIDTVA